MRWIDKCIDCLKKSSIVPRIVVIDNCSTDQTVDHIKEYYPDIHLITNKENKGFGQANNQGIEYAYSNNATHFFLLNQDAYVRPDTIERLVRVQKEFGVEVVSPVHLNGSGKTIDGSFGNYILHSNDHKKIMTDYLICSLEPYYKADYINAACWLLSRGIIVKVGGFDPLFSHYGEDNNYCQRVVYHHGTIAFVPNTFVCHDREDKGNITVYNKNSIRAIFLKLSANVNNQNQFFNINLLRWYCHILKILFIGLLKFDFTNVRQILKDVLFYIGNIKQIKKSCKINREEGPSWLGIQI